MENINEMAKDLTAIYNDLIPSYTVDATIKFCPHCKGEIVKSNIGLFETAYYFCEKCQAIFYIALAATEKDFQD